MEFVPGPALTITWRMPLARATPLLGSAPLTLMLPPDDVRTMVSLKVPVMVRTLAATTELTAGARRSSSCSSIGRQELTHGLRRSRRDVSPMNRLNQGCQDGKAIANTSQSGSLNQRIERMPSWLKGPAPLVLRLGEAPRGPRN